MDKHPLQSSLSMEHNQSLLTDPHEGTQLVSSSNTSQPLMEIADSIRKTAGCTYVFGLSVYDMVDQAVRRVQAFYGWSGLWEQNLQQKADHTYETWREKGDAVRKLLSFAVVRIDHRMRLCGHLDAVKRLLELFMNEELAKLVLFEDLIAACIMAWVVINHGTEIEWGYDMAKRIAWNRAFVNAFKFDARKLYRSAESNYSNRTHQSVEFDQVYTQLLDFFTRHCGIKPPESNHYSVYEIVELVAFEFPALRGLKNAVSYFLPAGLHVLPGVAKPNTSLVKIGSSSDGKKSFEPTLEVSLQTLSLGPSSAGEVIGPMELYSDPTLDTLVLTGLNPPSPEPPVHMGSSRFLPISSSTNASPLRSDTSSREIFSRQRAPGWIAGSNTSLTTGCPQSSPLETTKPKTGHFDLSNTPNFILPNHAIRKIDEVSYPINMCSPSLTNSSGNSNNTLDLDGTTYDNRRTVFIFALELCELSNGPHSSLLNSLSALSNVVFITTFEEFFRELDSFPDAVLILEPTIAQRTFMEARVRLVNYVIAGGTVIFGAIFKSVQQQAEMDAYFANDWCLAWKTGSLHKTTFSLRSDADLRFRNNDRLLVSYNMEALNITGIQPENAVYIAPNPSGCMMDECPIALIPLDRGFVGYIGDLNMEEGSIEVYITMLGLRGT